MTYEEKILSRIALISGCFAQTENFADGVIKAAEKVVKWEAEVVTELYRKINHGYIDEAELHIILFNMGLNDRIPNMEMSKDGERWFDAVCEKCGWEGSSQFLLGGGQIADTGDYSDPYCPNCGGTNNF